MYKLIDGKLVSKNIKEKIAEEVATLKKETGKEPGLAVVLVGNDPASQTYVNSKVKMCKNLGVQSFYYSLAEDTPENDLIELIRDLNTNNKVNGILVQLPLPSHIDETRIINEISPIKDVDGFHPINVGMLWTDQKDFFTPCTPLGIMELFDYYKIETQGKNVVILGRSNIVGRPLAGLFLKTNRNATVTVCHSKTSCLPEITQNADILVAAIGKAEFIKADMIKKDAVIIDVGINRVPSDKTEKGYIVTGDVDFDNVCKKASWITPVPGGVGALTVTMLLKNTLQAFKNQNKIRK